MAVKQTAGRTQLGEFAPKFAELNDDVLLVKCGAEKNNFPARPFPCDGCGTDGTGTYR